MAEQAKAPDYADAYRGLLTYYDAKISLFKEIHPYLVWANVLLFLYYIDSGAVILSIERTFLITVTVA